MNCILPDPPQLHRSIGTHKWMPCHVISYLINKPIVVEEGFGYLYIIAPNGKKYQGLIGDVNRRFLEDGYTQDSLATRQEYLDNVNNNYSCYYNRITESYISEV